MGGAACLFVESEGGSGQTSCIDEIRTRERLPAVAHADGIRHFGSSNLQTVGGDGAHFGRIEAPVGTEDDSSRIEIIADETAKNPFTSAAQKNLRKIVTQILSELDPKEETVLRQRFGMSTNKTSTLEEVGEYIGVTRERIRQIEQKALNKLKHPTRARKLRSFLED